ncbi:MAG: proline dehydrogenase family protein [Gemmatimonadota bacterium]
MLRSAIQAASRSRFLRERLPRYRFARRASRRFLPGEDVEDALAVLPGLSDLGISAALTQLGEDVADSSAANEVLTHYHRVLERVAALPERPHISIKPSQLGLDLDVESTRARIAALAGHADDVGTAVWIDMESSRQVDPTLQIFHAVLDDHRNVGICLQAYLHRTPNDIARILPRTSAIRLVKGAYAEPATAALQDRPMIDRAFAELTSTLLDNADRHDEAPPVALGTHDWELVAPLISAAEQRGLARDAFEVQMLYGIRTKEQRRLASEGHRVRVLINYGPAWFPWFMRRLAERPANLWFVARNAVGG